MKKRIIFLFGIIVFISAIFLTRSTNNSSVKKTNPPTPIPTPSVKQIKIGNTSINATIADTESARTRGLTGIDNLPADEGMLFVFESKDVTPSFWMKGMKFPLDFIWIKGGQVSQIDANIPYPSTDTMDSAIKVYIPTSPVDYVLEVNSGFSATNNIKVGDTVYLSL